MRTLPLSLLLAIACAAGPAARLRLDAPARAVGREGAVQIEVRLTNEGDRPAEAGADFRAIAVRVRGAAGEVACDAPAEERAPRVLLARGVSAPLRVDVTARCALPAGAYAVELAHAGAPPARVALEVLPRTWVNPGPR